MPGAKIYEDLDMTKPGIPYFKGTYTCLGIERNGTVVTVHANESNSPLSAISGRFYVRDLDW